MTRLQKKCLVASGCFHGLMLAVFLATAAFRTQPPPITAQQILTLIPGKVLDTPGVGGGPVAVSLPPQPARPVSTPPPPATHPQPAPAAPPRPATPATPPRPASRQSDPKPTVEKAAPDTVPKTHQITPTFTPATPPIRSSSSSADSSSQARAATQAAAQAAARADVIKRAQEVADAFAALDSSVRGRATPVSVATLPGEGGGDAFVNYRTAVFNAYYQAWKTPETGAHRLAVADVKIVVARNGDVISSEFVSKSGDAAVDQSVQRALDQVERQKLPPFPPKSEDTERTFILRFNLEAKQSAG